jgi:hypothetical protein
MYSLFAQISSNAEEDWLEVGTVALACHIIFSNYSSDHSLKFEKQKLFLLSQVMKNLQRLSFLKSKNKDANQNQLPTYKGGFQRLVQERSAAFVVMSNSEIKMEDNYVPEIYMSEAEPFGKLSVSVLQKLRNQTGDSGTSYGQKRYEQSPESAISILIFFSDSEASYHSFETATDGSLHEGLFGALFKFSHELIHFFAS